jgi:hypothetical protein
MKTKTLKIISISILAITGSVASLSVDAVQVSGTLGTSSAAIDTYTFTCPTGTAQSRVRVMDLNTILNTTATVFATFGEDANPTLTASDTESTTTGSLFVTNRLDGPGIYALIVHKSAANQEDYIVEAQCLSSLGADIPVKLFFRINQ